jgi:hypothetical protein
MFAGNFTYFTFKFVATSRGPVLLSADHLYVKRNHLFLATQSPSAMMGWIDRIFELLNLPNKVYYMSLSSTH